MFMQTYIPSKIHPDWNLWDDFLIQTYKSARDDDSLSSTHRIEEEITDTSEISEKFDAVTYSKGASLIHWMQNWLGEENFRRGYVKFLKQHKYSNACSRDLFDALETVSKKPVYDVMNDWITKKGHPLVTVYEESRNSSMIVLKLWQKRFSMSSLNDGPDDTDPDEDYWQFPLE